MGLQKGQFSVRGLEQGSGQITQQLIIIIMMVNNNNDCGNTSDWLTYQFNSIPKPLFVLELDSYGDISSSTLLQSQS